MVVTLFSCQSLENESFTPTDFQKDSLASSHDSVNSHAVAIDQETPLAIEFAPGPVEPIMDGIVDVYDDVGAIPVSPVTTPLLFAQSPFNMDPSIPPWQANYVGSYGVLPTRYAARGPFLYSFTFRVDDDDRRDHQNIKDTNRTKHPQKNVITNAQSLLGQGIFFIDPHTTQMYAKKVGSRYMVVKKTAGSCTMSF